MTDIMLGKGSNLEGWIQGIVVLLVIAGSLLKPITKALIDHFGPKKEAPAPGSARPADGSPNPRIPVGPSVEPTPPVARATQARPTARPQQPAPSRPRPPAQPKQQPTLEGPKPAPPVAKARKAVVGTEERFGPLGSTSKQELGHVESVFELRDDQIELVVEEHLGHLRPTTAPAASKKRAVKHEESLTRPTRSALRRAVVLSEVLQPPLALRKQEG